MDIVETILLTIQLSVIGTGLSIFLVCISDPRLVVRFMVDIFRIVLNVDEKEKVTKDGKTRTAKQKPRRKRS